MKDDETDVDLYQGADDDDKALKKCFQFHRHSTVSILDDYNEGVVKTIDGCAEMEQVTNADNTTLPNKYDDELQDASGDGSRRHVAAQTVMSETQDVVTVASVEKSVSSVTETVLNHETVQEVAVDKT